MSIKVENYTKIIKNRTVLKNINIEFQYGKIYGLYGRNGSGKTMLMRAISGLIHPTEGRIIIDDKVLHEDIEFPLDLGIIIENTNLLDLYDGYTNLKLIAKIKKIAGDEEIRNALYAVGLDPEDRRKIKAYSLGMKQKLAIAQAILEKPRILLLDEPTNALDEESVNNIRSLLIKMRDEGVMIIVASHNKDDLSILSDTVLHISEGQIIEKR